MGISSRFRQANQAPSQGLPTQQAPVPMAAPPPFEFAPRPQAAMPYQTPERLPGSGTGAQPAFASQRPMGFDPVQSFLSSLPALGSTTPPPDVTQAYQVPPSTIGFTAPPPVAQPVAPPSGPAPAVGGDELRFAIQRMFG